MKLTLGEAVNKGVEAYQAGQIQEAEGFYNGILRSQPNHPDANHNMGLLTAGVDKMQEALAYFKIALEANPSIGQYWLSYIGALIKLEKLDDAKVVFNQAKDIGVNGDAFDQLEHKLLEHELQVNETNTMEVEGPNSPKPNILDTTKLDKALRLAKRTLKDGQLEEAKSIYEDILQKFPKHKQALIALQSLTEGTPVAPQEPPSEQLQLIINIYNQGKSQQALSHSMQMLNQFPNSVTLYNIAGASNVGLMQFDAAIANYVQVLKIKPNCSEAYYHIGLALNGAGDPNAAISSYKRAINIKPDYAEAYNNMGIILSDKGDLDAAIDSYKRAINIKPDYAEAYSNMATTLTNKGDLEASIDSCKQALKIKPDYAEAYNNMGIALKDKGDLDAAINSCKQALKIKPDYAEAYNNMGIALKDKGDLDAAINSYKKALKIKPDYAQAYNNMSITLNDQGNAKAAIGSCKQAIKIMPDYAEAYYNMGIALKGQGDLKAAIGCYKESIKIKPDYAEAYYNMGIALKGQGDLKAAIGCYKQSIKIKPDRHQFRAQKLHLHLQTCDWPALEQDRGLIAILGISTETVAPFAFLPLEDAPERHRVRSENHAKKWLGHRIPIPPVPIPSQKPERLRIGYFSADFKNHPVMYALIEVLEQHNRVLFETYAYSCGPDSNSKMRQRIIKAVDVFKNVKGMDDHTVALLARKDNIDIAIDLTGYTKNGRTGIFAYRAAPIQISMLGYPGTSGTSFIDYIMTDQTWLPPENQKFFSEKPIYLPYSQCTLEANIPLLETTPTRSALGLPEEGFVFCAINSTYKITPAEFDIWMRLLQQVDGSVLWLLESNQWVRGNLVKEAEARGVDAKRLVFQPLMVKDAASQQQYLSQFRQADLYLDTFIYGAGSTAANALWAGVPVLTLIGQGMPTRMAASYLNVLGLSELITTTDESYEKLAFDLSTNPERLKILKQKLGDALRTTPLFNNALQTKCLENGYQQAYQRYFDDQLPDAIFVPEHLL
jgi:protein O-GlcNAc transferase